MKKSKFKMVAGIAAIAMSFAMLAGCTPGDDATADTTGSTGTEQAAANDNDDAAAGDNNADASDASNASGSGSGSDSGSGSEEEADEAPESAYKLYTVTTTSETTAESFALTLQVDNDGSQDENGLKVTISDFELWLKVDNKKSIKVAKNKIELIPDQYAPTAYSKSSTRFVLDGLSEKIPSGAKVQFEVIKATVDKADKKDAIIFALQRDIDPWDMLAADSEMWQPIFAAAE